MSSDSSCQTIITCKAYTSWFVNKHFIEIDVEKLLSSCGNMMYEDRRNLCKAWGCKLFHYCESIEPSEKVMIVEERITDEK